MPHRQLSLVNDPAGLRAVFAKIRAQSGVSVHYPHQAATDVADPAAAGPREDLETLPLRTLDPAGSRDLDQAFHLARRPGGYVVHYAIADVAAFVPPGGALDGETRRRAVTVYCPDIRVPLHPASLCEGAGSLLPGKRRPAVVWRIELGDDGEVGGWRVFRAWVRSRSQHTYTEAQEALNRAPHGQPTGDEQWDLLREIGQLRVEAERRRGGVSLTLPEQEVALTPDGWQLTFRGGSTAEEYNAQLSLLTGMVAAQMMLSAGVGVLRTMPPAPPERLEWLRLRARAMGVCWPQDWSYGQVLAAVDPATPAGAAFMAAAASLFRGAAWTAFDGTVPAATTHAAIAAPYAHVTAPLRRLVDRFATEVCLAVQQDAPIPGWVHEALGSLGETMAQGTRREGQVDRQCTEAVEAAVLTGRVGDEFPAVAVTERTIQIAQPAILASCTPASDAGMRPGSAVQVTLTEACVDPASVRFQEVATR